MQIVRFYFNERVRYGRVENERITHVRKELGSGNWTPVSEKIELTSVRVMAPVEPGKVIALGYNYKDLVGEQNHYNEPIMFLKPPSSVVGPGEAIRIIEHKKTWVEVELAIVIGRKAKNVGPVEAAACILGYTVANDVTMQNVHERDHHLARSKGIDTFCPLGPWIETELDPRDLALTTTINGAPFQNSRTSRQILGSTEIVSYISKFMTLNAEDVILTGTPANAESSVIQTGDRVSCFVEGIGTLENTVEWVISE